MTLFQAIAMVCNLNMTSECNIETSPFSVRGSKAPDCIQAMMNAEMTLAGLENRPDPDKGEYPKIICVRQKGG